MCDGELQIGDLGPDSRVVKDSRCNEGIACKGEYQPCQLLEADFDEGILPHLRLKVQSHQQRSA